MNSKITYIYNYLIPVIIFLIITTTLKAQQKDSPSFSKNGFYTELYLLRHDFSDGIVSFNYERTLGKKGNKQLRLGIYPDFESAISLPLTFSWMTGPTKKHHFEFGIGMVFRIEHYVDPYVPKPPKEYFFDVPAVMIPLMYRFQSRKGLYFRAGLNVFVSWPTLASPSLSIGYSF